MAVDPIEKKPLFHFLPASSAFSFATLGCNLKCTFCQNHEISQARLEPRHDPFVRPELIVQEALANECAVIAHTYSEPTIYYEYAYDVAVEARRCGVRNVFVSNGYINRAPLQAIAPCLDAANIDLKSFSEATYKETCKGRLGPVLDTIRLLHELSVWLEVTTLVVPGLNDSPRELSAIAEFLSSVSTSIPWHVSGFHPAYHMQDRDATTREGLEAAVRIGKAAGLEYVYGGNLRLRNGENTECPSCGATLIERERFSVASNRISGGCCPDCGHKIAGVFA